MLPIPAPPAQQLLDPDPLPPAALAPALNNQLAPLAAVHAANPASIFSMVVNQEFTLAINRAEGIAVEAWESFRQFDIEKACV